MLNKIREILYDFFARKEILISKKDIEILFKEIIIEVVPITEKMILNSLLSFAKNNFCNVCPFVKFHKMSPKEFNKIEVKHVL